jgi:hypothetical protein
MNNYLTRLVRNILIENVEARDNWMLVIKAVHDKELDLLSYTKADYYDVFFSQQLSNTSTIRRIWQLVQENNPELRGNEWEERQRQGGLMKQEIVDMNQLSLFEF